MKKKVAVGILRAWIAFGIIFVPVVSFYISYGSEEDALTFFVVGSIVGAGGILPAKMGSRIFHKKRW